MVPYQRCKDSPGPVPSGREREKEKEKEGDRGRERESHIRWCYSGQDLLAFGSIQVKGGRAEETNANSPKQTIMVDLGFKDKTRYIYMDRNNHVDKHATAVEATVLYM